MRPGATDNAQVIATGGFIPLVLAGLMPICGSIRCSLGVSRGVHRFAPVPSLWPGVPAGPLFARTYGRISARLALACFDAVPALGHDWCNTPRKKERAACGNLLSSRLALWPWPCRAVSILQPNARLPVPQRVPSLPDRPVATPRSARLSAGQLVPFPAAFRACRAATDLAGAQAPASSSFNAIRAGRPGGVFVFASYRPTGAGAPVRKGKEARCSRRS